MPSRRTRQMHQHGLGYVQRKCPRIHSVRFPGHLVHDNHCCPPQKCSFVLLPHVSHACPEHDWPGTRFRSPSCVLFFISQSKETIDRLVFDSAISRICVHKRFHCLTSFLRRRCRRHREREMVKQEPQRRERHQMKQEDTLAEENSRCVWPHLVIFLLHKSLRAFQFVLLTVISSTSMRRRVL